MKKFFPSISFWLMLPVFVSQIILFIFLIFGYANIYEKELLSEREASIQILTENIIETLEESLFEIEDVLYQHNNIISNSEKLKNGNLEEALNNILLTNKMISWIVVAKSVQAFDPKGNTSFSGTGMIRKGNNNSAPLENNHLQQILQSDWLRKIWITKQKSWSPTFADIDYNSEKATSSTPDNWTIVFTFPLLDKEGEVKTTVSAAYPLKNTLNMLDKSVLNSLGAPFLYMKNDYILKKNGKNWQQEKLSHSLRNREPFDLAENYSLQCNEALQNQLSGVVYRDSKSKMKSDCFYFRFFPYTNRQIGFELSGIHTDQLIHQGNRVLWIFSILGIVLASLTVYPVVIYLTRAFRKLDQTTHEIISGNFEAPLTDPGGCRELSELVDSFTKMRKEIRNSFLELRQSTTEEENIKAPLKIAGDIQHEMLPDDFNFARRQNIDLFAFTKPVQENGGDFYDFRMIDDKHLYFCLGDVSDRGIPASLFMSLGLSFIRVAMYMPLDPAKVLSFVNKQLRKRNGKSLFMTVLCGIYSLNSNEVVFASAGLNPPVKIDKDGQPQLIQQENCLPLAIMDNSEYNNIHVKLEPGETLFIYTDEVLYSMNKKGECFGTERLLENLRNAPQHSTKSIGKAALRAVRNFSEENQQMDDMTILLFKKFE